MNSYARERSILSRSSENKVFTQECSTVTNFSIVSLLKWFQAISFISLKHALEQGNWKQVGCLVSMVEIFCILGTEKITEKNRNPILQALSLSLFIKLFCGQEFYLSICILWYTEMAKTLCLAGYAQVLGLECKFSLSLI